MSKSKSGLDFFISICDKFGIAASFFVVGELLEKHIESTDSEIEKFEGVGALNFLQMDDLDIYTEGEDIHEKSIFKLPTNLDLPKFPEKDDDEFKDFLQKGMKI